MRALIVEDDPTSCKILQKVLSTYGQCDVANNGKEAVEIFRRSLEEVHPYDLICMDIMMPKLNGQDALRHIRDIEQKAGIVAVNEVKVMMTSALDETKEVVDALFKGGACAYFVKPIQLEKFVLELKNIGLVNESD